MLLSMNYLQRKPNVFHPWLVIKSVLQFFLQYNSFCMESCSKYHLNASIQKEAIVIENPFEPILCGYDFTIWSVDAPYVLRLAITKQRITILQSAPWSLRTY